MVQSIDRAFAILDAVAAQPAGVTAIAKRVELPKSTVARLLAALEQRGAVERPDGVLFRIGPGVAALAAEASAERSVAVAVRPELTNLVRMVRRVRRARLSRRLRGALRRPGRVRQRDSGA